MAKNKESFFETGYLLSSGVHIISSDESYDVLVWDPGVSAPSGSTWNASKMNGVITESFDISSSATCVSSFFLAQNAMKKMYEYRRWGNETIPPEILAGDLGPIIAQIIDDENDPQKAYHPAGGYANVVPENYLTGKAGYENAYVYLSGLQDFDCGDADYWMIITYIADIPLNQDHTVKDKSIFDTTYRWSTGGAYLINGIEGDMPIFDDPEWTFDFVNAVKDNPRPFAELTSQSCLDVQTDFGYAWHRNTNLSRAPLFPIEIVEDPNALYYHAVQNRNILMHGLIIDGKMQNLPTKFRACGSTLAAALNCGMDFETFVNPPQILSGISKMDAWQRDEYELPDEITWGNPSHTYTKDEWLDTYCQTSFSSMPLALIIGKRGRSNNTAPNQNAILWPNHAWDEEFKGESLSGYLNAYNATYLNRSVNVIFPHGYYTERNATYFKEMEEIQNENI